MMEEYTTTTRSTVRAALALLLAALAAGPAGAEMALPPGFTAEVHVTGTGFDRGGQSGESGIPAAMTLAVDADGALYLAASGNRYGRAEAERVLSRVYRIPPGGARLTPDTAARYAYGPPLPNPEVGAVSRPGELFLTTADADRRIGVVYRLRDGRIELFAGGTPAAGGRPVFRQPEGVALDAAGNVYVADRIRGVVVKLDPAGRLLEPQLGGLRVARARMLAMGPRDELWIAGDGTADQPWQDGTGQIWRLGPTGSPRLAFDGPHAAAIAIGPGGTLFVAQRHTGRIVALAGDGPPVEFARFTGEQPRTLAFGPSGDLFVVSLAPHTWYLNQVVRVSGPFAGFPGRPAGSP
ncbi:MAG: hypothetical protein ACREMB_13285 [Candidatus Rokuibacteriota bacterium]